MTPSFASAPFEPGSSLANRLRRLCGPLLAIALLGLAAPARAQSPMGGAAPPMPILTDLHKVPLGSWAEYKLTIGNMEPMKQRISLVSRDADTDVLELAMEGGMVAKGAKMILQVTLEADPAKEGPPRKVVMQLSNNDPMEMPVPPNAGAQFMKVSPKKLGAPETVTVAGGKFRARPTKTETDQATVQAWLSPDVAPLGLVKMISNLKNGPTGGPMQIQMELVKSGKGDKPVITKAAGPFNQRALIQQMTASSGGVGGPAAGPGPGPASAPPAAGATTTPPPKH